MKKLTLMCDYSRCDTIEVTQVNNRACIEIKMDIENDQPTIMLSKSDVAELIEFLNGLELHNECNL